ncbi:MAG TPA: hypothetical protein VJB67_03575 [Patescibacteria group bacterium]|nr:hypothetical protein [Patescibacteria group bacterium]
MMDLSDRIVADYIDVNDVSEITEDLLIVWLSQAGALPDNDLSLVHRYMATDDHGYAHSVRVWRRCQELITECPLLWRMIRKSEDQLHLNMVSDRNYRLVLIWASVLHDFSRFIAGTTFDNHQYRSAVVSSRLFTNQRYVGELINLIEHHDYFCEIMDGLMPIKAMTPLAELFRLADKTSVSPAEEILRYHQTGNRRQTPFFDPTLSDQFRFNLYLAARNLQTDQITWFLMLFVLQSTDFIYRETADQYARWARGKKLALAQIAELCLQHRVDYEQVFGIIVRFMAHHKLMGI